MFLSSKVFNAESCEALDDISVASRRVIFNADVLKSLKVRTGDIVAISKLGVEAQCSKHFAAGIVWPSLDLSQDAVLIPISLQLTARIEPGDRVRVFLLSGANSRTLPANIPPLSRTQEAGTIRLKETYIPEHQQEPSSSSSARGQDSPQNDWLSLLLRETLVEVKYITNFQVVEVTYERRKRRFTVISINSVSQQGFSDDLSLALDGLSIEPQAILWKVSWDSRIIIIKDHTRERTPFPHKQPVELTAHGPNHDAYESVGGLDKQIEEIRTLLEIPLNRPELFRHFGLRPPRGILLHGPPGTGKTHLARAIASSTKSSVLVVNGPELSSAYHGETESKLRDVFKQARDSSPCIVVLDEIDALVPRREDSAGGEVEKRVVATLLTLMDGMEDEGSVGSSRVIVIGTTNRPNAIDPALRRPGRFDREIEIGIPDAEGRLSILNVLLLKTPHSISAEELRDIASQAHGYVGADLSAVVREAGMTAIKRGVAAGGIEEQAIPPSLVLTGSDLAAAMPTVRPSAMRSLFIDTPVIHFADIGGQSAVIQKLRETVEWPLLHPETFRRLGVRPPKGVLLYGPPGCSKTILARACACESGVNFLAVKGPEGSLLNKFVGESERAVREIFRKARAAAPSLIFFDEVDALAISRSSSAAETLSSVEGVLTSLLNELDGVQELVGVTVLAATNRPEAIDSALMRPGRLDRILYVGPPDNAGREEILRIRMRTMTVDPSIDVASIASLTEGYSGAELTALCQEAAILTMQRDMDAPFVPQDAFIAAAKAIRRQITPTMLEKYARWRNESGAQSTM